MRVDKPLTDLYPACTAATGERKPYDAALDSRGVRVLNFTRVEVPGSSDVHWMLCHVRPTIRDDDCAGRTYGDCHKREAGYRWTWRNDCIE